MSETLELSKEGKVMHYTSGRTIRELVDTSRTLGIAREDVVQILKDNGLYYLVYYYGE